MAEMRGKKVNIAEVARRAGVSKMTVSRLLNHSCKVAPDTRERIRKVIEELQFQPNPDRYQQEGCVQNEGDLGVPAKAPSRTFPTRLWRNYWQQRDRILQLPTGGAPAKGK